MTRDDAPRRARTIYLSDEVWEALDVAYMEERVARTRAGGGSIRKTEFIEGIIETHLKRREGGSTTPRRRATAAPAAGVAPEPEPTASPSPAEAARSAVPARPRPRRAGSALERMRAASDPGRPAAIESAAQRGAEAVTPTSAG